jgi:carbon monoxide dehydrogenase subunit G
MDLSNEFTVPLAVDRAWNLLTDVERIAPCMPGAQLTGVEGDTYSGKVTIKLGPVTAQYAGTATFESKDDVSHVAVLRATGRDSRGQGNASALITATLEAAGEQTQVSVRTELTITGKVAQFGRGVIIDVSAKLLDQFVRCLESSLIAESAPAAEPAAIPAGAQVAESLPPPVEAHTAPTPSATTPSATAPSATSVRDIAPAPAVEPLDLGALARGAVLKRAVPAVIGLAVIVAIIVWLVRR